MGGFQDQNLADDGVINYGYDHYTCFQFAYDWRRDIVEGAKNLHRYVESRWAFVQAKIEENYGVKNYDVKINLIAHSMGGLLARYYLMYGDADLPRDGSIPEPTWKGAKHIGKLIMIGTPNGGSVKMLTALLHGSKVAPGIPKFEACVIATMPSTYQLMPRTRHGHVIDIHNPARTIDLFDIENWEPLLNSPIKWNNVLFIFSDHLGLTKHPMFTDNVLYQLLEHAD